MATNDNPIPQEARPKVAAYIGQMPAMHALVMGWIIEVWWADYKAVGWGRWEYWWRNYEGAEVSPDEVGPAVGLSAEDVNRVIRELAEAGEVSVTKHVHLPPEQGEQWYTVLPARAAVLLNVGIADKASYQKHMAFVEIIYNAERWR